MTDDPPIPSLQVDSRLLPPELGYESWRQMVAPIFDVTPVAPEAGFRCRLSAFHLDELVIGATEFDATRFSRSRRRIRADGLDHVMIQIYTSGGYVGELDRQTVEVQGQVACLDLTREIETTSTASSNITMIVPRDMLPSRAVPHGPMANDDAGAVVGGLFADHLVSLMRRLPSMRASSSRYVVDATLALLRASLAPTADALEAAAEPVHDSLLLRARRLIEAELVAGDPNAERLAATLRISRSTLYRLFEPFGGVAAYVMERRLVRARAALRDAGDVRRIGDIATACGFTDASHFSRAFRRRFGVTPVEARREGIVDLAAVPVERADLGTWIHTLI